MYLVIIIPPNRLLGDGVQLSYSAVVDNQVQLCLVLRDTLLLDSTYNNLTNSLQGRFDTYDFAHSDAEYTTLTPANIPLVELEDSNNSNSNNSKRLCGWVQLDDSSRMANYFPIVRQEEWENEEYRPYGELDYR